jgi:hypothetical protein
MKTTPQIPASHRFRLACLFVAILIGMLTVTVRASLVRSIMDNGPLMRDVWFQATLADAYFGFVMFYVWIFYQEKTTTRRAGWFVAIMLLGNIAMATYALLALRTASDSPAPTKP